MLLPAARADGDGGRTLQSVHRLTAMIRPMTMAACGQKTVPNCGLFRAVDEPLSSVQRPNENKISDLDETRVAGRQWECGNHLKSGVYRGPPFALSLG